MALIASLEYSTVWSCFRMLLMHNQSIDIGFLIKSCFSLDISVKSNITRGYIALSLNKNMFVSSNMPKKVRVGRSAFLFIYFFAKGDFVSKIGGKIRFAIKIVKNCENSVFWVIYKKKEKKV